MIVDEQLQLTVAQTVDSLTFLQSHVIDTDFRAHSKTTIESVISLQKEQQNRIEQSYGPRPASPDFLACQLQAMFRGEVTSIALSLENGSEGKGRSVIDQLTDTSCVALKKDIKHLIHEWEYAYTNANGVEPSLQSKTPLMEVYHLYKLVRTRVVNASGPGSQNTGASATSSSSAPTTSAQPTSSLGYASGGMENARPRAVTGGGGGGGGSASLSASGSLRDGPGSNYNNAAVETGSSYPASTASGAARNGLRRSSAADLAAAEVPSSSSNAATASGDTRSTAINSPSATSVEPKSVLGSVVSSAVVNTTPAANMTLEEVTAEKRQLKRVLHEFEGNFERKYERRPNRAERHEVSHLYWRYGELKDALAKQWPQNNSS